MKIIAFYCTTDPRHPLLATEPVPECDDIMTVLHQVNREIGHDALALLVDVPPPECMEWE